MRKSVLVVALVLLVASAYAKDAKVKATVYVIAENQIGRGISNDRIKDYIIQNFKQFVTAASIKQYASDLEMHPDCSSAQINVYHCFTIRYDQNIYDGNVLEAVYNWNNGNVTYEYYVADAQGNQENYTVNEKQEIVSKGLIKVKMGSVNLLK